MFKSALLKIAFLFLISFNVIPSFALDIAELKRAVVKLRSEYKNAKGQEVGGAATGFFIRDKYQNIVIATVAHYCISKFEDGAKLTTDDGRVLTISRINILTDLCILKIDKNYTLDVILNIKTDYSDMNNESEIIVAGYPLAGPFKITEGKAVQFVQWEDRFCSLKAAEKCKNTKYCKPGQKNDCIKINAALEISAEALPGNSGSPVMDQKFNVVGIVFAADNRNKNGLITPASFIIQLLEEPELKL